MLILYLFYQEQLDVTLFFRGIYGMTVYIFFPPPALQGDNYNFFKQNEKLMLLIIYCFYKFIPTYVKQNS